MSNVKYDTLIIFLFTIGWVIPKLYSSLSQVCCIEPISLYLIHAAVNNTIIVNFSSILYLQIMVYNV